MIEQILSSVIDGINFIFEKQFGSIDKKFLLQINTSISSLLGNSQQLLNWKFQRYKYLKIPLNIKNDVNIKG